MKNKFLTVLLICLFALFSCAGCDIGTYYDKNSKQDFITNPTDPSVDPSVDPNKPEENSEHYTATLYYGSVIFEPTEETEITVIWRNKSNIVRVPLGADGKADAGELNGNYNVYLTGLPSEYSYNPNGYIATSDERKVSILITDIHKPDRGDGGDLYVGNGCFSVRDDGTYRANISEEGATLFYEYSPRSAGVYLIESWVDIYDDSVNPLFNLYGGSSAYKWFIRTLDVGGAASDGGFSKNFRYEFAVSASEVGNVCTFAIGAVTKSKEYPVSVDFAITYLGPYTSSYADIRPQSAKEARANTPEPGENFVGTEFVYADMGTKLYDASKFKLSDNTGYYHLFDSEKYGDDPYGYGIGFGPILMCDVKNPLPSYSVVSSLYGAVSVGPNNSNYLLLYNVWIEEEQKFAVFDYTNFIRVDYNRVCNSEGKCYVTEELRRFLQKFAENHSLYTDGVGSSEGAAENERYTPEEKGYTANQDALWLFACGFYL